MHGFFASSSSLIASTLISHFLDGPFGLSHIHFPRYTPYHTTIIIIIIHCFLLSSFSFFSRIKLIVLSSPNWIQSCILCCLLLTKVVTAGIYRVVSAGMKRVAVKSKTTSKAHLVIDDQVKFQFRHHTLLQDHLDLQKEVIIKKKKLQAARQKRDILLAEIRFLRRRHRHLLKLKSAETEPQNVQHETSNTKLKRLSRKRNSDASEAVPSKHSQMVQEEG